METEDLIVDDPFCFPHFNDFYFNIIFTFDYNHQ